MKNQKKFITIASATAVLLSVCSCMIAIGTGTTVTVPVVSALSQHLITANQAQVLSNEYAQNNYQKVSVGKNVPETKEVYYDIEVLEDYLKYVKSEAKKNKIKDVGIVIAFGQYPNSNNFDTRLNNAYKGQQTVYLKAAVKPSLSAGKVGIGGYTKEENNAGLSNINAFDFGHLTPPE